MKCKIGPMGKSERDKFKRNISVQINEQMGQVIKDREMMAGCRAQWMLLAAITEEFGFAKKRLRRILTRMESMVPELYEDRQAEVMDEILINYLERVGLDIRATHEEYFECAERLRQFEKFIAADKKSQEEAEAERERKEALERRLLVLGKEALNEQQA